MSGITDNSATPSRVDVWKMFDRIAPRYDLLNRLLSLRQDVAWRRKLGGMLPDGETLELLDLATGTGDQALFLMERCPRIIRAVGMDLSEGMLERGREKVAEAGLAHRLELVTGDATIVPVPDQSFDVITIAFGIRNVTSVETALANMQRALRPGGRLLVLECSLPANALLRSAYLFYFRHVLPRVGGLISGDADAYRYLNQTVESFPYGEDFCALMRDAGLTKVGCTPLTLGVASIYRGDKPCA